MRKKQFKINVDNKELLSSYFMAWAIYVNQVGERYGAEDRKKQTRDAFVLQVNLRLKIKYFIKWQEKL